MKNWKKLKSNEVFSSKYFHLRVDECETFDGRVMPRYYVVDFPDWVQVVALTVNRELILVEQYRYPGQKWFLEFPGGTTHASRQEDPLLAAQRELREETGYESVEWTYVGAHYPNPALMSNRCHVFLAQNCALKGATELDPFEELRVRLLPWAHFCDEIQKTEGQHALMLATFAMVNKHFKE